MKQRDLVKKLENGICYEVINMKQTYPTFIINTNDDSTHPFLVCVPDMDILTEGENLTDAIEMARDAIGVAGVTMEDKHIELPLPSCRETAIKKVKNYSDEINFADGILTYVDVDFTEYRKKTDTKAVRKNVTIPGWLNYEAERSGINVSRVLQEALMNVLNIKRNY